MEGVSHPGYLKLTEFFPIVNTRNPPKLVDHSILSRARGAGSQENH